MDILLFGGQSNMQGQTERLSENAVVPGAYEYRLLTDTVIPLQNPVGEHIRTDRTPGYPPTLDRLEQWLADHIVGAAGAERLGTAAGETLGTYAAGE